MPYQILAKAPQNRDFAQLLPLLDAFRTFDWKGLSLEFGFLKTNIALQF